MGNDQVTEIPGVPTWAVNLVQQVAEIRVKVESVPRIERELDELRKSMIPVKEHEEMVRRVDDLWDTRSNLVPQWQESKPKLDAMWDERAQIRGILKAQRWVMAVMSLAVAILTVWLTLRSTGGIHISAP